MTVGANLHRLIYNLLIVIVFPYIFCDQLTLKNIHNTRGFVALTEWQQVGWRLIKVGNYDNKKLSDMHSRIWFYILMKLTLLQVILNLNNHWLDLSKQDSGSNRLKGRSKIRHHTVQSNRKTQWLSIKVAIFGNNKKKDWFSCMATFSKTDPCHI